ncbi:hypothetical protein HYH03_008203 [Edaphochlamys debaryana]|uniref:phytol kinase n=1 Tax=Edaphochlamys debaryana TaxID=47281 RepID=A0A836BZS0_9CHLO|nr:hypothetical protein HYH03_008203 [Edaphochlamys debaryana]|eukprot:KAG2493689.1 hypothetical protein HYH03_008203 [Edaphochlamys debaryana]
MALTQATIVQRLRALQTATDVNERSQMTPPRNQAERQASKRRQDAVMEAEEAMHDVRQALWLSPAPDPQQGMARLKLWMDSLTEAGSFAWLAVKMAAIPPAVDTVADRSAASRDRCIADARLDAIHVPALDMLDRMISPIVRYTADPATLDAQRGPTLWRIAAPLWKQNFLKAAAGVMRSSVKYAKAMAKQEARRALASKRGDDVKARETASMDAYACSELAHLLADYAGVMCSLLLDLTMPPSAAAMPNSRRALTVSPAAAQLTSALVESQLLRAVARAILRCPEPNPDDRRERFYCRERVGEVQSAANSFVAGLQGAWMALPHAGPSAATLAAALTHPDLLAFQEAMLERLCVHGGVALERGRDREGQGAGEGGEEGEEKGRWWLPPMEAKVGHVIGSRTKDEWRAPYTYGWLEQVHCAVVNCLYHALYATWGPPGSRRPPPPPLLLQHEPRALEALLRLHRGQGLDGAYTPQPTWVLFAQPGLDGLMTGTSSAESASWGLALNALAVEAELAGQWSRPDESLIGGVSAAEAQLLAGTSGALNALVRMTMDPSCTPEQLGASDREELQEQLVRANLAASLDVAMRQAFTAADRAATTPTPELQRMASAVAQVPMQVGQVLGLKVLPPAARIGDGGGLVTLAKRATMLTQRLQELEAAGTAAASRQEKELLAGVVHSMLPAVPKCLKLIEQAKLEEELFETPILDPEVGAFFSCSMCLLVTQAASRAALLRRVGGQAATWLLWAAATALLNVSSASHKATDGPGVARVLACQPHRLLAAGCKLLCDTIATPSSPNTGVGATGDASQLPAMLATMVVEAVARLAAHPQLCESVRTWLAPPEGGASADAATADPAAAVAERGCLEPLIRALVSPRLQTSAFNSAGAALLPLLRAATDAEAFPGVARTLATNLESGMALTVRVGDGAEEFPVPGSGGLEGHIARERARRAGSEPGQDAPLPDVAALVAAPLPPPLAVPLAEAALRELRVCAYPGCLSYGGRSEAGLTLKLCARCKCVRYCGAACQTAHWKAGHKEECQAAAAAAGAPPA